MVSRNPVLSMKTVPKRSFVHRWPFFYGWVVAAVGTLGMSMTGPGQTPVISIFTDAFIADLGLSRSTISLLYTVGSLIGGVSLSVWGRQIDRYGSRLMFGVITGLFGVACIYVGSVQNALMLGLGFVALRMLGQGGLALVSQNVVNQWWVQRRGLVMGISGVATSILLVGLFPNVAHALLGQYGWRITYPILGGALLLGLLPLGLVLLRDRPEEYGLRPDGRTISGRDRARAALHGAPEAEWTLAEAISTPAFWVVALSIGAYGMLLTGLFFHMVSIFDSRNLSAEAAVAVYVPVAATSAVVRLGGGYLADRVPLRVLLVVALISTSLILGMVQILNSVTMAMAYGVLLGLNGGLFGIVMSVVWASYFGRRHLGSIAGMASTFTVIGSALGPLPLALAYDLLGSYNEVLTVEALIPLALAVANLFVRRPGAQPSQFTS
jgi:sugar phosphate permease